MPPASARRPTIPGATFSAACWSRRSNRASGKGGRPSFANIQRCSRRSPGRKAASHGSPSASSFTPAGLRLRTASASSSMWPSNASGSNTRWRRRSASTASVIRNVNDRGMKGRRRMLPFRAQLHIFVAIAAACLAHPAGAQTYPTQNITLQVAFAAGGIADVVARLVGQKLSERFGQTVVVENRGGAGGNLAAKAVSAAAADGYTILATTSALAVNETATKNKGFSTDDLNPVAIVAFSPDVIAVHPGNPAKDLREFVAAAKEKSFTYGSAGVGTGPHIGAEYFFRVIADVKAVHVPFTGGAPAVAAAAGGHIDAVVLTLPTVTPQINQGALRGLGLASDKRNSAVPDVPTYAEMGFPDFR